MVSIRIWMVLSLLMIPLGSAQVINEPPIWIEGGGGDPTLPRILDERTGDAVADADLADLDGDGTEELLLARDDGTVSVGPVDGEPTWTTAMPGDAVAVTSLRLDQLYVAAAVQRYADDLVPWTPGLRGLVPETAQGRSIDQYILDATTGDVLWKRTVFAEGIQGLFGVDQSGDGIDELVVAYYRDGDTRIQSVSPDLSVPEHIKVVGYEDGESNYGWDFGGGSQEPIQYDETRDEFLFSVGNALWALQHDFDNGVTYLTLLIIPGVGGFEQVDARIATTFRDGVLWIDHRDYETSWSAPGDYTDAALTPDGTGVVALADDDGALTANRFDDGGTAGWTTSLGSADEASLHHLGGSGRLAVVSQQDGTVTVQALAADGTASLLLEEEMALARVLPLGDGLLLVSTDGSAVQV